MKETLRHAVLLDRLPLWLEAVAGVVTKVGVDVVAKTTSASVALRLIDEVEPDLFVVGDLATGLDDALECLREAHARHPGLRSIVLSEHTERSDVERALAAGARAYVMKTAHPEDLSSAVRQAFEVSVYFPGGQPPAVVSPSPERTPLTRRELEILALAAQGSSNATIAGKLWVTQQTVKFHLSNIYRKLQVSNRTEAARWAHLHGLAATDVAEAKVA
jgi:DNA-binding NarL/FixJ family response regulator